MKSKILITLLALALPVAAFAQGGNKKEGKSLYAQFSCTSSASERASTSTSMADANVLRELEAIDQQVQELLAQVQAWTLGFTSKEVEEAQLLELIQALQLLGERVDALSRDHFAALAQTLHAIMQEEGLQIRTAAGYLTPPLRFMHGPRSTQGRWIAATHFNSLHATAFQFFFDHYNEAGLDLGLWDILDYIVNTLIVTQNGVAPLIQEYRARLNTEAPTSILEPAEPSVTHIIQEALFHDELIEHLERGHPERRSQEALLEELEAMDHSIRETLHRLNNPENTFDTQESLTQLQELLRRCQSLSEGNLRLWEDRIRSTMQWTARGIEPELPLGFSVIDMLPETRDALDQFNQIGRRMARAFDLNREENEEGVDRNAIIAPWLRLALRGTITDSSVTNRARRTFTEYFSALQRLITPVLNATRRSIWRDETPIPPAPEREETPANLEELIAVDHGGDVNLGRGVAGNTDGSMRAESSTARSEG